MLFLTANLCCRHSFCIIRKYLQASMAKEELRDIRLAPPPSNLTKSHASFYIYCSTSHRVDNLTHTLALGSQLTPTSRHTIS